MKKKTASNGLVSAEDFVRAWQTAATFEDVVKAFPKSSRVAISSRAVFLRKNGVTLKKFSPRGRGSRSDYKALASLAKSLAPSSKTRCAWTPAGIEYAKSLGHSHPEKDRVYKK